MVLAPSLHSLFITGILILFIAYILLVNYKTFINSNYINKITILSLIAIAFGIHGLIHLGVEQFYGFNPYKWIY